MILPKAELLRRNAVSGMLSDIQLQPAGIDLTLREIHRFTSTGKIDHDNKERELPSYSRIDFGSGGWLHIDAGAYKVTYNEIVKIPSDCIALGFPRSTLLRCGATLECAVWDPGYEGRSESLLVVSNPNGITLKRDARLMQLIFAKLTRKARETYSGKYHKENVTPG